MSIKSNRNFDIVVVGGGLAGLTATLALSHANFSGSAAKNTASDAGIALIMPISSHVDGRTTALLGSSVSYLEELEVWQDCISSSAPLSTMRILDGTNRIWRAPPVDFKAIELGLVAFGYNIANSVLADCLLNKIKQQDQVEIIEDSVTNLQFDENSAELFLSDNTSIKSKLVIAADGKNSLLRDRAGIKVKKWQYPQMAVALNFIHTRSHHNTSTEFHTEEGPITVVPMPLLDDKFQSGLVWVMRPENAEIFLTREQSEQERLVEEKMQSMHGKIIFATTPQQFPLSGMIARKFADNRVAIVGDAAHVFPPIGAQGFNLGLRDVREICSIASTASSRGEDPGNTKIMNEYNSSRRRDVSTRTGAVDMLNRSLLTDFLPVQAVRGLGLFALANIPILRRFAMRQGMVVDTKQNSNAA